jgi:hypothetical protein
MIPGEANITTFYFYVSFILFFLRVSVDIDEHVHLREQRIAGTRSLPDKRHLTPTSKPEPNWPIPLAREIMMEEVIPEASRDLGLGRMSSAASTAEGILGKLLETPRALSGTAQINHRSDSLMSAGFCSRRKGVPEFQAHLIRSIDHRAGPRPLQSLDALNRTRQTRATLISPNNRIEVTRSPFRFPPPNHDS